MDCSDKDTGSSFVFPKVLLVGNGLCGGGAETRLRLLAKHLFDGTADVAVLHGGTEGETLGESQRLFSLRWKGPRTFPQIIREMSKAAQAEAFDAVLSLGLYPNTIAWGVTRLIRDRPALVMTEITRPNTEGRLGGRVRHLVSHAVRRATYPGADLVGANSADGLEEVIRYYGVQPQKIRRLPNLVEPERLEALASDSLPIENPAPSICAVARLDPLKRIDTLIEAVAGLSPDLTWWVDILGDGPDRERLVSLAKRLGVDGRVRFHGWTSNPYPLLRRATMLALTSTYEGFSNTLLEAMTLGTPVITSLCSTDSQTMADCGAALGFPVGNHLALRSHIERLLRDARERADLGVRGRQYAARHFVPEAVREYEALIRDAIDRKKRARI